MMWLSTSEGFLRFLGQSNPRAKREVCGGGHGLEKGPRPTGKGGGGGGVKSPPPSNPTTTTTNQCLFLPLPLPLPFLSDGTDLPEHGILDDELPDTRGHHPNERGSLRVGSDLVAGKGTVGLH